MSDKKEGLKDDELEEAIALIAKGAKLLGFSLAIPSGQDEEAVVQGMIMGTDEYVDQMCECHNKLFGEKDESE